jgi:amiloride-sensitive sodium channel
VSKHGISDTFNMLGYKTVFNMENMHDDFQIFKRNKPTKFPYYSLLKSVDFNDDDNETTQWTLENSYSTNEDVYVKPLRALKKNELKIIFDTPKIKCHNVFKARFHLPNEMPTPFHKESFFKESFHTDFTLSAEKFTAKADLRRFSPDIRRCYFEGEKKLKFFKSYTKNHCDCECMTNVTLETCGCVQFSMPRSQDTPICDIDKVECYFEVMKTWRKTSDANETKKVMACDCYPSCTDIKYKLKMTKSARSRSECFTFATH